MSLFGSKTTKAARTGLGRGIEVEQTSNCCLEVLLYSLFAPQGWNPFLKVYLSQTCTPEQKLLKGRLDSDVIFSLRFPPFTCKHQMFRTCLQGIMGSSNVVDVGSALNSFGRRLGVGMFIRYSADGGVTPEANTHQLILLQRDIPLRQQNIATLLILSMQCQNLRFANAPYPGLLINLPRNPQGELIGIIHVIPSLTVSVRTLDEPEGIPYELWTILTMDSAGRYRAFVREKGEGNAHWIAYIPLSAANPTTPWVKACDWLEENLTTLETAHATGRSVVDYNLSKEIKHILQSAHCYIYVPPSNYVHKPPQGLERTLSASNAVQPPKRSTKPETARGDPSRSSLPTTSSRSIGDAFTERDTAATTNVLHNLPIIDLDKPNSKYGPRKGIEGYNNSCYLDVLLFSLFYETDAFDQVVLNEPSSTLLGQSVQNHLKLAIVPKLRYSPFFCGKEQIGQLRVLLKDTNSKMSGQMMDIDELISNLFGTALGLAPFISYTIGTKNYLHQIFIQLNCLRQQRYATVRALLQESLSGQALHFARTPLPALFIKMPRSKGALIGLDFVLPSFSLTGYEFGLGNDQLRLLSIICVQHHHYTVYVRSGQSQWVYFDSMGPLYQPVVQVVKNLEGRLRNLEEQAGLTVDNLITPDGQDEHIVRILKQSHVYLYTKQRMSAIEGEVNISDSPCPSFSTLSSQQDKSCSDTGPVEPVSRTTEPTIMPPPVPGQHVKDSRKNSMEGGQTQAVEERSGAASIATTFGYGSTAAGATEATGPPSRSGASSSAGRQNKDSVGALLQSFNQKSLVIDASNVGVEGAAICTTLIALFRNEVIAGSISGSGSTTEKLRALPEADSDERLVTAVTSLWREFVSAHKPGEAVESGPFEWLEIPVIQNVLRTLSERFAVPFRTCILQDGSARDVFSLAIPFRLARGNGYATIDMLLRDAMKSTNMTFRRTPKCLVLMPWPTSGGNSVGPGGVVPNTILNLSSLIPLTDDWAVLNLSAVICKVGAHLLAYYERKGAWHSWGTKANLECTRNQFEKQLLDAEKNIKNFIYPKSGLPSYIVESTIAVVYVQRPRSV